MDAQMIKFKDDIDFILHFQELGLECGLEIPLLYEIVYNPHRVVFVPKEDYDLFWNLFLEQEYYELLPCLEAVKDKVRNYSLKHFKKYV